jgi:hypothetical protein
VIPRAGAGGEPRPSAGQLAEDHMDIQWRKYQEETADLFRSLACSVEVEQSVKGARGEHKIDVWVQFNKFGLQTKWAVECKCWNTNVPKEKVLALKAIVDDIGADRGILISQTGFQSGAIRVATNTNITLTGLNELRETAQDELIQSVLHRLETRVVELKYGLYALIISERVDANMGLNIFTSKALPGVNEGVVDDAIARLAILDYGFERIRLKQPPYPVNHDRDTDRRIVAKTIDDFVKLASKLLDQIQAVLVEQRNARIC